MGFRGIAPSSTAESIFGHNTRTAFTTGTGSLSDQSKT
jgi:hypothetical protein